MMGSIAKKLSHPVPKVEKGKRRAQHSTPSVLGRRGEGNPGPGRVVGRGSAAEEMEEREKLVCLAKLAEQAERYDGEGSRSRALC